MVKSGEKSPKIPPKSQVKRKIPVIEIYQGNNTA